jgi:hypothetical protein
VVNLTQAFSASQTSLGNKITIPERMTPEPRSEADYSPRQTKAAHRVLVDVGQVLASFADCRVVVGSWAPDLLLAKADEPHVGGIEVDLALEAAKLNDRRYAELVKLLLDTKRYRPGDKDFQLVVEAAAVTQGGACLPLGYRLFVPTRFQFGSL